jgi:hypothetical protein
MGISTMTTTRQRATARLAARFGNLSRLAVLSSTATVVVVALGVTGAASPGVTEERSSAVSLGAAAPIDLEHFAQLRDQRVSRTAPRVALQPKATDHKFATAALNIWTAPREQGKRLGLLDWGKKVAVTGQVEGHWAEVLVTEGKRDVVRWVNADYLANKKPKPEKAATSGTTGTTSGGSTSGSAPAPGPSTGGSCTNGTSVSGAPGVVAVHQAVCANWPAITSYGTYRADSGDHGSGRAIDVMISGDTGWQIAEFLRANYSSFGISYIIFSQKIWSVDRAGEGWRYMEDRGSTTANHYDHVHVSVY